MGSVEELCDHIALIDRSRKVLDGGVREIRKRYSTRTFVVEFKGQLIGFTNALWTGAELLGHEQHEEFTRARVKLAGGVGLNDVLRAILPVVEVHGVQEEIPRMHEVFIRAVGENTPEVVKAEPID